MSDYKPKFDEWALMLILRCDKYYRIGTPVRETIAGLNMHRKRAAYILEKWVGRGWYDYGVCVDLGWLTPEGMKSTFESSVTRTTPA